MPVGGELVPVEIVRKRNKNAYLRLKPDGSIIVTAPVSFSRVRIDRFIAKNAPLIARARAQILRRETVPAGMMRLWGGLVPRPEGWNEGDYKAATLRAAATVFQALAPALAAEIPLAGVVFKARLMKTRFGSCAIQKRTVTLNSVLARYDERFLAAIVVHELVHFAHPDHGAGFYRTLLRHVPDYRRIRKELGELFRATEV